MAAPMIAAVRGSCSFSISLCLCDSVVRSFMVLFLELARMFFGPAFDYDFFVGIELDGVAALAVEVAEEAVLPSAEGEVGHGRGDSDVDADVAAGGFVAEAARGRSAGREERRLIAVGAALKEGERVVHVIGVDKAEDWAEDFSVVEIAGSGDVVEDGGIYEVAGFVIRDFGVASVEQNFCALLFAEGDEGFDGFFALRRNHGAHLDIFIETVADFEFRGGVGDGVAESLLRFADGDGDGDGEAALAGASEGAVADDLRGHGHVGVGENDDMILGSALALRALAVGGGARVDVFCYGSRSDEADGADFGMVEKGVHGGFAAVDKTYDAFGEAGFFEEFVDVAHGERDALGGLKDEGVAGGDGVRQIPERDHAGKVEGHDGGGDADGLANHHLVDAAGDVFKVVSLHHHGDTAGDLHVFNRPAHFGFGFGESLAVFLRDDAGDVVEVIFEQHLQLKERLDAVFGRSAAPFGEGGSCGFDSLVDFGGFGKRDLGKDFTGGGVDDIAPLLLR